MADLGICEAWRRELDTCDPRALHQIADDMAVMALYLQFTLEQAAPGFKKMRQQLMEISERWGLPNQADYRTRADG